MDWYNILLYGVIALAGISMTKYVIYMVTTPFYSMKQLRYLKAARGMSKKEVESRIKVSAVIPAWNEEVGILNSIKSLLNNTYENLEIIVVNDGSTDNTDAVVQDFLDSRMYKKMLTPGKTVHYISKENGGKGSALNTGIEKSTGDLIITMDADTHFDQDAVHNMARYFIDPTLDAAVGNVKVADTVNWIGIVQQIEYTMGFYFKRTHSLFDSEYIIGGAFGAFRKATLDRFGAFDESNKTEDIELSTRLQYNGCKIAFAEDAIAYTEGASTIMGLFKQRLRWKKGRFDTLFKYSKLFFSADRKHKKFLTYFLLPVSMFYEVQLLLEPLLALFGIYYMIVTQNYAALISWAVLTTIILFIGYQFGSKQNNRFIPLLGPIYVLMYFIVTFAEIYAIIGSIRLLLKKEDVTWQSWNRKGVAGV